MIGVAMAYNADSHGKNISNCICRSPFP